MKSIKILSGLLNFFGAFSIILGLLFIVPAIFTNTLSLWLFLSNISRILTGLIFWLLASGLSKKEKWAWYTSFFIFAFSLFFAITTIIFLKISFESVFSISISVLLLYLLINGKKIFTEQPKENISNWLRKPSFIMVVVAIILSYIITGAALSYSYFENSEQKNYPKEETLKKESQEKEKISEEEKEETECDIWLKECAKEGESRCSACGCRDCCLNLISRESIHPFKDGNNEVFCAENMTAYVCVNCGDNICGEGEDWCICPEDCLKPDPEDLEFRN